MGFRDPTTINNTGAVGSATNPLTGTALALDRENQYSLLRLKGTQDRETLSILDGAITPTRSEINVDTEGSASADDLTTINLTSNGLTTLHSGMRLLLRSADASRVVTVKNGTGVNGITTYGGTNIVLSTNWDLELKLVDGLWVEQRNRAEYKADTAITSAAMAQATAAAASTPATTTARGIGRVATNDDLVDGATITNGPAFLAAGVHTSVAAVAGKVPVSGSYGVIDDAWVRQPSIRGNFANLKCSSTGTNANISCVVDEIALENSSNKYLTLRGVSVSASVSSSGAGGLDTGSVAASTWYYVHIIHNPTTSTTALLLSLSATAPTLPSGYTYWARVSAIKTDGTANKYPLSFKQQGRKAQYVIASGSNVSSLPMMASGTGIGSATTPIWVAVAWGAFAPPTASMIQVIATNQIANQISVVPNNNFGAIGSSNPPPSINYSNGLFEFCLEGSNIYWANQGATSYMTCLGWEDNL